MKVLVSEYTRGGRGAVEESNDASVILSEWLGPNYPIWERTDAFINVYCDDNEESVKRLIQSLTWLRDEIIRRKGDPRVTANGQPKS